MSLDRLPQLSLYDPQKKHSYMHVLVTSFFPTPPIKLEQGECNE
jgi:hypothetical protein